MDRITITATRREVTGKKVNALRREGKLPAVLYGYKVEATPITIDAREANRILIGLAPSTLVTIELDGKKHNVLVREKQFDFIRGMLKHVDFQAVSLTRKIRSEVPIELTGTAPAVKELNGIVTHNLNAVAVEALPQDLPERFLVDISGLDAIGSQITVGELEVPEGVEVLTDPSETVVVISGMAAEVVEEVEEEVTEEGAEPEVIERGKREEEEEEE